MLNSASLIYSSAGFEGSISNFYTIQVMIACFMWFS